MTHIVSIIGPEIITTVLKISKQTNTFKSGRQPDGRTDTADVKIDVKFNELLRILPKRTEKKEKNN